MNTKADVKVYCLHHLKEEKPILVLEMTASGPLYGYLEHVWISPLQILLVLLDLALLCLGAGSPVSQNGLDLTIVPVMPLPSDAPASTSEVGGIR